VDKVTKKKEKKAEEVYENTPPLPETFSENPLYVNTNQDDLPKRVIDDKDGYITVLPDDAFTDTFADDKEAIIGAIYEESTAF